MSDTEYEAEATIAAGLEDVQRQAAFDIQPVPVFPFFFLVSGLYERRFPVLQPVPQPQPIPTPIPPLAPRPGPVPGPRPSPFEEAAGEAGPEAAEAASALLPWFIREELRLDVDGRYPQMTVSGTLYNGLSVRVHWIASVVKTAAYTWQGNIWFKDGTASALPHTHVLVKATPSFFANQKKATVTFSGGGAASSTRTFNFKSSYYHPVEFEFDTVSGTAAVTQINTCAHPNRPASLPCETLSAETVFRRAGFNVSTAPAGTVPIAAAGANARWSDAEMHDAMQIYWSSFANKAQWSMWVLFANLHDQGTSLGGIMFDDIGPNHRQGCSVFNGSFIANAPAGDPNPAAWVQRMRFWTACHEMGHCFNLAHSWQKAHPPSWGTPWIPLANEPLARSFMNYPYNVPGGQTAFFANFEYRFSDSELLFMRHAPARFVQMGNADWFDHHGFEQAETTPEPAFRLEVGANRRKPEFEFLEPVVLELRLTNISGKPQIVPEEVLSGSDEMTVIVKKEGKPARQWAPFARYCLEPKEKVLAAGETLYQSLFAATGRNGWDLAEPGRYIVQVCLHMDGEDVLSAPFAMRIAPPRGYDEEYLAQDFLSADVARVLAFDGSQVLTSGNDVLMEAADRFAGRRVAVHARIALGCPLAREYKSLVLPEEVRPLGPAGENQGQFAVGEAKVDAAQKGLEAALLAEAEVAAETLGFVDYKYYAEQFALFLEERGDGRAAGKVRDTVRKALSGLHAPRELVEAV